MNVLEKILEEIEERVNMVKNIPVNEDDDFLDGEECYEAGRVQGRYEELVWCRNMIRSHMDEVQNCGECSRRKWYQKGYEDGKKDNDWIPVSDKLPEDDDMRFYMCIVENHEEDLPMFCQYDSEYGFGFWHDIYDSTSLGFVDTVFKTNDELGYEKVVAWQPLPEPMRKE